MRGAAEFPRRRMRQYAAQVKRGRNEADEIFSAVLTQTAGDALADHAHSIMTMQRLPMLNRTGPI